MSVRHVVFVLAGLAGLVRVADPQPARGGAPLALPPLVGATELYQSQDASGLALNGFDPVSYFLEGGPQPGRAEWELVWNGVAWRFASAANRAAFARDPTVFAPRIGGYDAESASRGRVVDADPAIYVVRSGRLYVFRNDANRARFLADEGLAERSERGWRELKQALVQP